MNRIPLLSSLGGVFLATAIAASASPSGLNNIPTADTAGNQVLVLQAYSTGGHERRPDHTGGFKYGWVPQAEHRFEFGADSHYAPGKSGPLVLQAKYAIQYNPQDPAFSVGVANMAPGTDDRRRAGQPFGYAVVSHSMPDQFRIHAGYGIQKNNNTALVGADKTFKLGGRDFMLRGDLVQIQNRDQWMGSVGFLYVFHDSWALESWVSAPFERGEPSFTLKLNWIFDFKKR